jgi:hypothetical protein
MNSEQISEKRLQGFSQMAADVSLSLAENHFLNPLRSWRFIKLQRGTEYPHRVLTDFDELRFAIRESWIENCLNIHHYFRRKSSEPCSIFMIPWRLFAILAVHQTTESHRVSAEGVNRHHLMNCDSRFANPESKIASTFIIISVGSLRNRVQFLWFLGVSLRSWRFIKPQSRTEYPQRTLVTSAKICGKLRVTQRETSAGVSQMAADVSLRLGVLGPFAFCLLPFAFCLLPFAFCLLPKRNI